MNVATPAPTGAETPTEVALRLTGRDYVSYSALTTYAGCPLRYFFRYVAGLPEETVSASLILGTGIHAAVEHHFRELLAGAPAPSLASLRELFWEVFKARREEVTIQFGRDENEQTLGDLAGRILMAFQNSDLARPRGRVLGIEEELRGQVVAGTLELLARVDLIVETDESLVVIDFKTARSRWTESQVQDSGEQLILYSELARQLAPGKPVQLEFAVLTKAKTPSADRHAVAFDAARVARTRAVLKRVWRAIAAEHFYPAPSPLQCSTCAYQTQCRAWQG